MILDLIDRARRRLLWNTIAIQCAYALNIGIGALLLVLIFGSSMVDWRWLVVLPVLRLVLGVSRACVKFPGAYSTAQRLDGKLQLSDALSTAVFFRSSTRRGDEGMREAQWLRASQLAAGIRAADVFPVRMPRAVYLSVLLAAIAVGLFAWRYRFEDRLDLRMPMAAMQQFLLEQQEALARLERALQREGGKKPDSDGEGSKKTDASGKQASEPAQADAEDRSSELAESGDTPEKQGSQQQPDTPEQSGEQRSASSQRPSEGNASPKQEEQTSGNQESEFGNPKSSVLSKITDTMANLLSAITPRPGSDGAPQQGEMARKERSRDGRQEGKPGTGREGRSEPQGSASRDGEGGQNSEQAGASRTTPLSPGSESQSEMMQGTGAGRQDGDKQTNMADQIAAMGKISVILGKRAEALSGTASVELHSGENRLRTQYENRSAQHAQASATTDRDEIPLALQEYVKEYFKQVNAATKQAAVKGKK